MRKRFSTSAMTSCDNIPHREISRSFETERIASQTSSSLCLRRTPDIRRWASARKAAVYTFEIGRSYRALARERNGHTTGSGSAHASNTISSGSKSTPVQRVRFSPKSSVKNQAPTSSIQHRASAFNQLSTPHRAVVWHRRFEAAIARTKLSRA